MAALIEMNEPLVTRVVDDLVAECRIPSFRSRHGTPSRLAQAQETREKRTVPQRPESGSGQKAGVSISQFGRHRLRKRLARLGNSFGPERERTRFEQVGDGSINACGFHRSKSMNGASLLGSRIGEAAGGKDLRYPLFQRRPSYRGRVAPIGLRALPRCPGLLSAEILVRVIHQGIEPALGPGTGERVNGDPLFQGFPNRKIVLLLAAATFQEPRAPGLQRGPYDLWELIRRFSDDANPQNDDVPFRERRCALCQLLPRHEQGFLQGSLLAVAPHVENEVCGVSFRHPRLVSGGGRLDCLSKPFYCTNSSDCAEERSRPTVTSGETGRAPSCGAIEKRLGRSRSRRHEFASGRVREDVRLGYDHSMASVAHMPKLSVNFHGCNKPHEPVGLPGQENRMSGLSMNVKRGEYRVVLIWLLLLGSWQFLAAPGGKCGVIGALGAAAFLVYAWANLDRLTGLGLDHARWRSAPRANWVLAGASGVLAGSAIFLIGSASGQNMSLSDNWRLIALQVTLGPVLEEVVFRGYLFAFLTWLLTRVADDAGRNCLVVVIAAVVFAAAHLAQPGVSWLQLACITSTGTLYGWIRYRSGSTAPAAVSHAMYNLALYAIGGVVPLGENVLRSP